MCQLRMYQDVWLSVISELLQLLSLLTGTHIGRPRSKTGQAGSAHSVNFREMRKEATRSETEACRDDPVACAEWINVITPHFSTKDRAGGPTDVVGS